MAKCQGTPGELLAISSQDEYYFVHVHPLPTPLRSKTLYLLVPAVLLAGQNSPHKEENASGERCGEEGPGGKQLVFEE